MHRLLQITEEVDFAIFYFAKDMKIEWRGRTSAITVGNVLLEYGLFTGSLGKYNNTSRVVICKHGNPRLRAALVECAWRMVRFQPQYPPVQKRLAVLAKGSRAIGPVRKKAIVAVARHLAVDLWRLHTGRCTAEQLGLKF